jgi:hypothetical protein
MIKIGAETAEFHAEMEKAARRIESTGRRIAKIGREISMAISLPIIAAGFAAFHTLLEESHRHFGPLYTDFQSLKANTHDLFLALGRELQPVFLHIIELLRRGIAIVREWIDAFHRLPQWIKTTVVYALLFLAALGPTVLIVGKLITAFGALIRILPILFTATNLATGGIILIGIAMIYAGTHTEWAKYRLVLFSTFLVSTFFDAVGIAIDALDILSLGITKLTGASDFLRRKLEVLEDKALGKLGGRLVELEKNIPKVKDVLKDLGNQSLTVTDAINQFYEAQRRVAAQAHLLGAAFDYEGAQAGNLKTLLDVLIANNVTGTVMMNGHAVSVEHLAQAFVSATEMSHAFNMALGAFGPRLDQQLRAIARFNELLRAGIQPGLAAEAVVAEGKMIGSMMTGLVDALTSVAERIGEIFAGVRNGFHGFAAMMGQLLAGVLKQIGQTLIQMGTAAIAVGILGKAIKFFAKNPIAAIAAGAALVALGSALAASSERTLNAGLAGSDVGSSVSSSATGAATTGPTTLILRLETPDGLVDSVFRDPRNQVALAKLLEELGDRQVIIDKRSSD